MNNEYESEDTTMPFPTDGWFESHFDRAVSAAMKDLKDWLDHDEKDFAESAFDRLKDLYEEKKKFKAMNEDDRADATSCLVAFRMLQIWDENWRDSECQPKILPNDLTFTQIALNHRVYFNRLYQWFGLVGLKFPYNLGPEALELLGDGDSCVFSDL